MTFSSPDSPFLKQIIQQTGILLKTTYSGADIVLGIFHFVYVFSGKIQRCPRLDLRCGYHFYKSKSAPIYVIAGLELQSFNQAKCHTHGGMTL